MATIRAMVAEKQQQRGHSTDDETIKGKVRQHLIEICKLLPDDTPVGREFANIMSELQDHRNHEEAVKTLIAKAMDEQDDLHDYQHIREMLVDAINRNPVVQDSCFLAYFDILGFKNIVKQSSIGQLKNIVKNFASECVKAIDKSRRFETVPPNDPWRISLGKDFHVQIVSDSIYIWSKQDERLHQFDDLLQIVNGMLAAGFRCGIPLRCVVTYGELFWDESRVSDNTTDDYTFIKGSLYGRALVEAYELEGQMDWSGAILTPRAWAKVKCEFERGKNAEAVMRSGNVKCAEDLFNHFPHLLWYDVPFKNGKQKAIAYNWNYKRAPQLTMEEIKNAFLQKCSIFREDIKKKLDATISFYEHTQHVAELSSSGLSKILPTPDAAYVFTDLLND